MEIKQSHSPVVSVEQGVTNTVLPFPRPRLTSLTLQERSSMQTLLTLKIPWSFVVPLNTSSSPPDRSIVKRIYAE